MLYNYGMRKLTKAFEMFMASTVDTCGTSSITFKQTGQFCMYSIHSDKHWLCTMCWQLRRKATFSCGWMYSKQTTQFSCSGSLFWICLSICFICLSSLSMFRFSALSFLLSFWYFVNDASRLLKYLSTWLGLYANMFLLFIGFSNVSSCSTHSTVGLSWVQSISVFIVLMKEWEYNPLYEEKLVAAPPVETNVEFTRVTPGG